MLKIADEQIAAVSARGAATLRAQSARISELESENFILRDKIASMERDEEIESLAAEMEEKGLNSDLSYEEKVAHLSRTSDLSRIRDAVKLASAGGIRLADVADLPGRASGQDSFSAFCVTGVSE